MTMADRIGVMDRGRLVQVGPPRELYEAPVSRWIAGFVGDINLIEGRVASREAGRATLATRDGGVLLTAAAREGTSASDGCIAIRPEKLRLAPAAAIDGATPNRLSGRVLDVSYQGSISVVRVTLPSGQVLKASRINASRDAAPELTPGAEIAAWFAPEDGVMLDA